MKSTWAPRAAALIAVVSSLGAGLACGPSFQVIYEGNARFEHCYALEENPQSPVHDKTSCWRDWSEHYTYGQTRDRIHYATARYVALSQATNLPTDEALMMAAPGVTPRESTITAPAPTNAFAPPPKVLEDYPHAMPTKPLRPSERPMILGGAQRGVDAGEAEPNADAGAGAGPASGTGAVLPASDCGGGCAQTFRNCGATCATAVGTGGPKSRACVACDKNYKACMRRCFK